MIPQDSLQAVISLLTSDRITYKGSEIPALNKVLNDVGAELNAQAVAARVSPAPLKVVPNPPDELKSQAAG